jgi:hypothetical protein
MRTSLWLSILLASATGACTQSLTPNMTGTGGAGTGTADVGGSSNYGSGGYGGNEGTACNMLTAEYQSAVIAAGSCQVGASGQCQQLVSWALGGCSCPTYVTDSSALNRIQMIWQADDCQPIAPPCAPGCPATLNSTCLSTDGGSTGVCSYVMGAGGTSGNGGTGASGGTTGAGGSPLDGGLDVCGTLASEYAATLIGAKSCIADAGVQCATTVPASLSSCPVCMDFVTDGSALNAIQRKWEAADCERAKVPCPLFSCVQARGAMCAASDAGGAFCSAVL